MGAAGGQQFFNKGPRLLMRESQGVGTLLELGRSLAQAWSWKEPGVPLLILLNPYPLLTGRKRKPGPGAAGLLPVYPEWV